MSLRARLTLYLVVIVVLPVTVVTAGPRLLPLTERPGAAWSGREGRPGSSKIERRREFGGIAIVKVRKAVIPAAGLGTRFLPATKAQPKEMLPLVDKPSIQYVIEEAVGPASRTS